MQWIVLLLDLLDLLIRLGLRDRGRTEPAEALKEQPPWAAKRSQARTQPASTPVPALKAAVCKDCLWRSGDTCTAAHSPVSHQRCEPVCSGRVVCEVRLQVSTDGQAVGRQPLDGAQLFRMFNDPGTAPADITALDPHTLSRKVADLRQTQVPYMTVLADVTDEEIARAILAYAREAAARPPEAAVEPGKSCEPALPCPRCGSLNPTDSLFCESCGAAVAEVKPEAEVPVW
jgi:hypothetical protein